MHRSLAFFAILAVGCAGKSQAPEPATPATAPTEEAAPSPAPIAGAKKEVFRQGDVAVFELGPDTYEVIAPGEKAGVGAEYDFLETLRCGGEGRWKVKSQALFHEKDRAYDKLDVVCTSGGEAKTFTFDITSFFGKL